METNIALICKEQQSSSEVNNYLVMHGIHNVVANYSEFDFNCEIEKYDALILDGIGVDIDILFEKILEITEITKENKTLVVVIKDIPSNSIKMAFLKFGVDIIHPEGFKIDQIYLQMNNLLKKIKPKMKQKKKAGNNIYINPENRSIAYNDNECLLTKTEYKLLILLNENENKTVTYEDIHRHLWGIENSIQKYRISNLIFHIRKKIELINGGKDILKTIRSKGYMLTNK